MKKSIQLVFITIFLVTVSFGQDNEKYAALVEEANQLYNQKAFLESGQTYAKAFAALGGKGTADDRYNAACSWALASETDSAFVQLFKIAKNGSYTNLGHITTDTDLNSLHADRRWEKVIKIIAKNKEKAEANLDKPLVATLDSIYLTDQGYRRQVMEIEEKYGWESPEMKAQWKLIGEADSINLLKVIHILDTRGWLGADVVGSQGNQTLFLVIQHSDQQTQEKYLPMMRDAVKKGNAAASSLALLEDRVALGQGKKQTYGSQIGRDTETNEYYVLPLEDPDNVDKRRAEVGLGTLQSYISYWGLTWDVEDYKRKLPEIEKKQQE